LIGLDGKPAPAALVEACQRIEDCNQQDIVLYEWIKERFARQSRVLGPPFFLDRLLFNAANNGWQKVAASC
jgi:hypothetical protein